MKQPLSPAPVYTQFYDDALPRNEVIRLAKWNRVKVLKTLISLKLAQQQSFGDNPHNLIIQFFAFLPNRPLKYGPIDRSLLTNKTTILHIIADLLSLPDNNPIESDYDDHSFFRDVMDTILIYNEHQFVNTGMKNGQKLTHSDVFNIGLMQELNAENQLTYARIGAIKQLIYLEFLKKQFAEEYSAFEQGVLDYTGLSSMHEIALLFIDLRLNFETAIKNPLPIVAIGPHDVRYKLLHNLDLVVDASSGSVEVKVAHLFTSPFLKLKDNNLYLLGTSDFDLITTKSWDYYLVKNKWFQKALPKVGNIHDLKGKWGKTYIESFLGLRILGSLKKNGLRVLASDDQNLPDATIIVNEKDVFMIEIKSSAMDYYITSARDVGAFQEFISKNFTTDRKGVPQLNRNIQYLAGHANTTFKIKTPSHKLRIYPIIIYTESQLTKQGINDYVNNSAPSLPDNIRNAFQFIAPVTMIPMDFFLENLRFLQQDRSLLRTLITEYHEYVRKMKDIYERKGLVYDYLNAMTSFEVWSVGKYNMYRDSPLKIFDTLRKIYDFK